jgi:hypothetical protein
MEALRHDVGELGTPTIRDPHPSLRLLPARILSSHTPFMRSSDHPARLHRRLRSSALARCSS